MEEVNNQLAAGLSRNADRLTDITRYIVVQSTKHYPTIFHSWCIYCTCLYYHLLDIFGDRGVKFPFRNLGIFLASGTR